MGDCGGVLRTRNTQRDDGVGCYFSHGGGHPLVDMCSTGYSKMIRRSVFIVLGTPFVLITALIGCGLVAIRAYVMAVADVMCDWFGKWRGE